MPRDGTGSIHKVPITATKPPPEARQRGESGDLKQRASDKPALTPSHPAEKEMHTSGLTTQSLQVSAQTLSPGQPRRQSCQIVRRAAPGSSGFCVRGRAQTPAHPIPCSQPACSKSPPPAPLKLCRAPHASRAIGSRNLELSSSPGQVPSQPPARSEYVAHPQHSYRGTQQEQEPTSSRGQTLLNRLTSTQTQDAFLLFPLHHTSDYSLQEFGLSSPRSQEQQITTTGSEHRAC